MSAIGVVWTGSRASLKDSDAVRVIDALAVHKDATGEIEVAHLSNLSKDERSSSAARSAP